MYSFKEEKSKIQNNADARGIINESLGLESEIEKKHRKSSPYKDAQKRFLRNKLAMAGLVIVIIMAIIAIFAPLISPYNPNERIKEVSQKAPSLQHWFGTDLLGRDIFSRVLYGSRISMLVGVVAVAISLAIGLFFGALSGFFGGLPDAFIMRIADIFFAFPYILGAIVIMTVLGPGVFNVFIAIGIIGWSSVARLFRSSILSIKEKEYIEAARAVGASYSRIIIKHILPNAFAPIVVYSTMNVGTAIIAEAALSFLGLGVQPPTPSWGKMLSESLGYINTSPWLMFFPGLAILITVLGFVLLGDGLRDAFDPRLKR